MYPKRRVFSGESLGVKEEAKFKSAQLHAAMLCAFSCPRGGGGGRAKAQTESPRCCSSSPPILSSGGTPMRVSVPLDTVGPATGSGSACLSHKLPGSRKALASTPCAGSDLCP